MDLSVVIPVYQCEPCLPELHRRLTAVLGGLVERYEIVFVEDGGADGSWDVVAELARTDPHVRAYQLSRNFGQQAAITAGLAQCRGDWAVVMDGDLQDPPEVIPELFAAGQQGLDIVFARRKGKKQAPWRRLMARSYFRLRSLITGIPGDAAYGSFSLIGRPVIDGFLQVQDRDRHYLGILTWLGYRTGAIDYAQADRYAGASSYSWRGLMSLAADGLFFQTTALLRGIVYLGFAVSAAGIVLAAYRVYLYFAVGSGQPGWTTLVVLNLVLGGLILTSTGIAALYIGRVFNQVKGRPLYVVRRSIGE